VIALEHNDMLVAAGAHPPAASGAHVEDRLSFSALFAVLRRRFRLFCAILLSTVAASMVAAFVLPVRYAAEADVLIDPRPHASPVRNEAKNLPAPDATLVETEARLMTSPSIMSAVIQRLRLAHDPEFAPKPGEPTHPDAIAQKLSRHVSVSREGLTYIVAIRARSHDPGKAAMIANTMADEYLRQSWSQRARLAADQARTLTAELGPLGQQVIAADQAVADYRAAHGIVSGGKDGTGGTVTDQQIETMAGELGHASADAAAARAAAAAARAQTGAAGVDSISQVLNSSALTELRNQRAQVLREKAQISTIYSPEHPAYVRIDHQLAQLDDEIKSAANRIVQGLESDARAAEARSGALRGQLLALNARESQDASAMVVANGLQRNADAKRATYNDLSRNAQEQAQEARIGDVRAWVAAAARPPLEPSFPKKSIFLMLGLVLGSALGAGGVLGAEFLANGFRSADEIEAELQIPFLAAVPEVGSREQRRISQRLGTSSTAPWDYVVAKPASSFAESIRNIRATLIAGSDGAKPKAICVTSALMGEGKSVIAVALARVMAMSGDRVLLIDCDLRRSGLAAMRRDTEPSARPSTGLVEVLDGQTDPHAAIVKDTVPGLTFLGLDGPVFTPRDMFSGQAARQMIARLKSEYDFIIMDTPPVMAVTDAWTVASTCDATLLVIRNLKTPRAAARAAVDRLRRRGAKLHGVVLNRRPQGRGRGGADYYDFMYGAYFDD
jgi:capsular exopolysaccharide synthesis family protein